MAFRRNRCPLVGLDYADQRWHAPGAGRFLTADPYQASGGAAEPGSWNRYGYVGGDPANYHDRSGMVRASTPLDNTDFCDDFPGFCPYDESHSMDGGGGDGGGGEGGGGKSMTVRRAIC